VEAEGGKVLAAFFRGVVFALRSIGRERHFEAEQPTRLEDDMNPIFKVGALLLALGFGGLLCGACGSAGNPTAATSADVTITITGINGSMSFSPGSATAKVGQTVAWSNSDSITHAPTQDSNAFTTGDVPGGTTSAPIKMNTPGTFPYHCAIHPSMVGVLTVNP
jgi:plastocyanin